MVLLGALVATSALTGGDGFAGVLVLRKAPFPVVVLAAARTTAGLRLLGVA